VTKKTRGRSGSQIQEWMLGKLQLAQKKLAPAKSLKEIEAILVDIGDYIWVEIALMAKKEKAVSVDWIADHTCEGVEILAELVNKPRCIPILNVVAASRTSWPILKSPVEKYDTDNNAILDKIQLYTEGRKPLSSKSRIQSDGRAHKFAFEIWESLQQQAIDAFEHGSDNPNKEFRKLLKAYFWMRRGGLGGIWISTVGNRRQLKRLVSLEFDRRWPLVKFGRLSPSSKSSREFEQICSRKSVGTFTLGRWRNEIKKRLIQRVNSLAP
jgi:hypothetical protein